MADPSDDPACDDSPRLSDDERAALNARLNAQIFGPGVTPPDYSLIGRKSDYRRDIAEIKNKLWGTPLPETPPLQLADGWWPLDWETEEFPIDDSAKAILTWLQHHIYNASLTEAMSRRIYGKPHPTMGSETVRDAYRLARYLGHLGWHEPPLEPRGEFSEHEALIELEKIKRWVEQEDRSRKLRTTDAAMPADASVAPRLETEMGNGTMSDDVPGLYHDGDHAYWPTPEGLRFIEESTLCEPGNLIIDLRGLIREGVESVMKGPPRVARSLKPKADLLGMWCRKHSQGTIDPTPLEELARRLTAAVHPCLYYGPQPSRHELPEELARAYGVLERVQAWGCHVQGNRDASQAVQRPSEAALYPGPLGPEPGVTWRQHVNEQYRHMEACAPPGWEGLFADDQPRTFAEVGPWLRRELGSVLFMGEKGRGEFWLERANELLRNAYRLLDMFKVWGAPEQPGPLNDWNDIERAIRLLAEWCQRHEAKQNRTGHVQQLPQVAGATGDGNGNRAVANPSTPSPEGGERATPKTYLRGRREILEALGLANSNEKWGQLRRLNELHNGPIINGGRGEKPTCEKQKLVEWWNKLEDILVQQQARERDKKATVDARHSYGRDGDVVVDIHGGVKRRRRPSK